MAKKPCVKNIAITLVCITILIIGVVIIILQLNRTSPFDYNPEEIHHERQNETIETHVEIHLETLPPAETILIANTIEEQAANLQKLAMVWGFVKYTHLTFLTGERCWDEELLGLIPVVKSTSPKDINETLYNWYIGLGNDGFEDNGNFAYDVLQPLICMDWLTDERLLGNLATIFSRFTGTSVVDRSRAPVSFDQLGSAIFSNQGTFPLMNANDNRYRLLGLFRVWNAMKYYFPYINIIDDCWNELLLEHIIIMLEGADSHSYQLTLASLTSRLHDPHIRFGFRPYMFDRKFGAYVAPLFLTEAEGQLVVVEHVTRAGGGSELTLFHEPTMKPGDVVLGVNGRDINDVINEMLKYVSYPNRDKSLFYLATYHIILRQHLPNEKMQLDVLRDGILMTVEVETIIRCFQIDGFLRDLPPPGAAHMILENNIGLINPSNVQERGIAYIMANLAHTDGLIIDLRQYPPLFPIVYELAAYLVETNQLFSVATVPSQTMPGVFIEYHTVFSGGWEAWNKMWNTSVFFYEGNVVVLMNERSFSRPEFAVLSLRNGENVTVMGSNSMGSNGDIRSLPLPGGSFMSFSSVGIFTPESGQTQRIGLEPDIRVERTIAGIRDGRDELMEAAIEFLTGNTSLR